ncbi:hypothetical protein [Parvibaculum sp.]|uniref:hypothetical protein n=1 Tax=Parvibaculum sp. TaxID=2024848 RepID=UPI002C3FCF96|nr:hypothetical protein [Parvibaculum sp.]HUD50867.1 hypothetical protein [Parvibaculum sp.]
MDVDDFASSLELPADVVAGAVAAAEDEADCSPVCGVAEAMVEAGADSLEVFVSVDVLAAAAAGAVAGAEVVEALSGWAVVDVAEPVDVEELVDAEELVAGVSVWTLESPAVAAVPASAPVGADEGFSVSTGAAGVSTAVFTGSGAGALWGGEAGVERESDSTDTV